MKNRKILAIIGVVMISVLVVTGALYLTFSDKATQPASSLPASDQEESAASYDVNHYTPPVEIINGHHLKSAQARNGEVCGWLEVAGTDIFGPVAQADDNTLYRELDWQKEAAENGAYFFDADCYVQYFEDLSPNVIIYGKKTDFAVGKLKNQIRFLQLERYLDESFMLENDTILLTTNDFETPYEVIAAGYIDTELDSQLLKANPTIEEFQEVLKAIDQINVHDTAILEQGIINIITLVAYTEDSTEAFIVVGKFAF